MCLVIVIDNGGFIVGNNQIVMVVVFLVEIVFLGVFNYGGIGVGYVLVGDVQCFIVCGGELLLVVWF